MKEKYVDELPYVRRPESQPNLQNIPVHTELGRQILEAFNTPGTAGKL